MKTLLFVPRVYSLAEILKDGFVANGWEAKIVDYQNVLPHWRNRFYERTVGLPNTFTKYWKPGYFKAINQSYLDLVGNENPDLILIYNNQFFFPETIERIKKKCKVAFLLGDNPLWSKTFDYNLEILRYSDYTISPDSHWKFELSSIGIPNIVCDYIGYSSKQFFSVGNIPKELKTKYQSDILFIGRNYGDSSGYKRTLFLNSFTGMDLKIFGTKDWLKWLPYFPELSDHFYLLGSRISNEELNLAINCCKVYPVDQNTGIVNGIHIRAFETIGAGTLPVMEWRKDIDPVFGNLLPVIKNYNEAREIVRYYLANEGQRKAAVAKLRSHIDNKYNPMLFVKRLISEISN